MQTADQTKSELVFFHEIDRFGDTARVQIKSCRIHRDGQTSNFRTLADYETLSNGATASAKRELERVRNEVADALSEIAGKLNA